MLGQTYRNIEVVVVLDDPADDIKPALLEDMAKADDRIRVVRNARNRGPGKLQPRGPREAKGTLIAIQDSDDVSESGRIDDLTRFLLENPDVGVVGSALDYVDEARGRTLMTRTYPPKRPARSAGIPRGTSDNAALGPPLPESRRL